MRWSASTSPSVLAGGHRRGGPADDRFVKEAGVDVVKLDAASDYPEAVTAITRAGIPVFAQCGSRCRRRWATAWSTSPSPGHVNLTWARPDKGGFPSQWGPDQADRANPQHGGCGTGRDAWGLVAGPLAQGSRRVPAQPTPAPSSARRSRRPCASPSSAASATDLGWTGMHMAHAAISYAAAGIDDPPDTYANVAQIALDAITAYAEGIRSCGSCRAESPFHRRRECADPAPGPPRVRGSVRSRLLHRRSAGAELVHILWW